MARRSGAKAKTSAGNGRKKKVSGPIPAAPKPWPWYWRYSAAVVVIGVAALAWMAVLTYSPADPPAYARGTPPAPPATATAPATRPGGAGAGGNAVEVYAPTPATRPGDAGDFDDVPVTPPLGRLDMPEMPGAAVRGPAGEPPNAGHVADAPRDAPHRRARRVRNAAGVVGAYLAYGLRYTIGAGAYVALAFLTLLGLALVVRGRVRALPVRVFGVVLLVVATAAAVFLADGGADTADPVAGSAGVVGAAAGRFLRFHFAVWGGWTVLGMLFAVGTIVTAERLLLIPPRLVKRALAARRAAAEAAAEKAAAEPAGAAAAAGETPIPAAEKRRLLDEIAAALRAEADAARRRAETPPRPAAPRAKDYTLPSRDLLAAPDAAGPEEAEARAAEQAEQLQRALDDFGVGARVVARQAGPVVTLHELELAAGVKVSRVAGLDEDLARALSVGAVRVVSPLPGRSTIGVEVPNADREVVRLRELMDRAGEAAGKHRLAMFLGKDAGGRPIAADLARMPHLLIAGTTGSGKSVCINAILMSLLMTRRPDEVRFVLVDPKQVELAAYGRVPHLLCPVIDEMSAAAGALSWATEEMDRRYERLRDAGARDLAGFNAGAGRGEALPQIVVVVDELADMMMTAGKEVEACIVRIAQKARAVGIHLILATQRPSADVVTGLIKSNLPSRISFRVASKTESRIILDRNGAEALLGHGDMLLLKPAASAPVRGQGALVDDAEIEAVADAWRSQGEPAYEPALARAPRRGADDEGEPATEAAAGPDELFGRAVEKVLAAEQGNVSMLQRELSIGYARANRMIEHMAELGILGPSRPGAPRQCRITLEDWREVRGKLERG